MEELGLKPGPIIGQILNYLLEKVWEDPELNEAETLTKLAQDYLQTLRQDQD
jgi:tRNA nucleotidyltransferase (CCA-adding enzyme)